MKMFHRLQRILPAALLIAGTCLVGGCQSETLSSIRLKEWGDFSTVKTWVSSSTDLFKSSATPNLPPAPPPEISFTRYQPIYLDVASIEIVDEYKPPMQEPYVEHLLPFTPVDTMRTWVKDRLRAVGLNKSLQVIIKEASVISTKLPLPEDKSSLTTIPNRRYDAKLVVEIRIYGTDAMSEASIFITSTQANVISEGASLIERQAIFHRMLYALMESANAELERQIFKYFSKYIAYAQTP
jgi:hypothetical protein